MTDRIHSLTVVLENDMRADDVEALQTAIKLLKGVLTVEGNVSSLETHVATERARNELTQKLWDVLHPKQS